MSSKRIKAIVILVLIGVVYVVTCTRLRTPEIKGVVLDAETGQPIADARIYAKWERRMGGPGGQFSAGVDKRLRLKTKEDGTFLIRAHTLFNFIPSPIGQGGDFVTVVYANGYKCSRFFFFKESDFERTNRKEFEGVTTGKKGFFKMSKIKDPKAFVQNRRDVFSFADEWDKDYWRKEDQLFLERFGNQKWNDENIQYELAETYYRMSDYKSALRKLDEILEMNPTRKTKYFDEKYREYKSKLNGRN